MKILVWGSPYHVHLVEQLFEGDKDIRIVSREEEADIFYRIQGWKMIRDWDWSEIHRTFVQLARGRQVVLHWIGTDVLTAMKIAQQPQWPVSPKNLIKRICLRLIKKRFVHWAVAPWLQEELGVIGIQSTVIPIVSPMIDAQPWPMPEQCTVLSYLPGSRAAFFGADIVYQLAELNPNVRFIIMATPKNLEQRSNIEVHGWIDHQAMDSIYKESSCLVRLAKHDGLALTVLESLARGRYVIWSYDFPYVFKARTLAQAQEAILQVKDKTRPNFEGAEYVRTEFSPVKVRQMTKDGFLGLMSGKSRDGESNSASRMG